MHSQEKNNEILRFKFAGPVLNDPSEARLILPNFLDAIRKHKVVVIDMASVESMTDAYADEFFGAAAAECVTQGTNMNFLIPAKNSEALMNSIQGAIHRSLPPSLGGTASVH